MTTAEKITDLRDLDTAFSIREKVFVEEQGVPAADEYDQHDRQAGTRHYLARYQGHPAGAARWRRTDAGVKLERFAVLDEFRNQGIGVALVRRVLADVAAEAPDAAQVLLDVAAEAPDAAQVYLHAQLRAVPLYERTGFGKVGDMFEECDIQHYKMVLG